MIRIQPYCRHSAKASSPWLIAAVTLILCACPAEDTPGGSDAVGDIATFELPPMFEDVTDAVPETQEQDVVADTTLDIGADTDAGCIDDDGDGVCNIDDVCPDGDDTLDDDEDGVPDACDVCEDANDDDDGDEDGVPDTCDLCPIGDDTIDTDEDGTPDACDCDEAGDVCHANAFCVPTDDGVECHCLGGYEGDGITTCANIDECAADPSPCVTNAACVDNDGGFTCDCNVGLFGDAYAGGSCDPCDASCVDCMAAGPAGCTLCASGYHDEPPGGDRNCMPCASTCGSNEWESTACADQTNRVCTPCHGSCLTCDAAESTGCTYCASGYHDEPPGEDRNCTPCTSTCGSNEWESTACADQTNRVCTPCHGSCLTCEAAESTGCTYCASGYHDEPPGGDRNCTACTLCGVDEYQSVACSDQHDRECLGCDLSCDGCTASGPTGCTACAAFYFDADPDIVDYDCTACTPCGAGEIQFSDCSCQTAIYESATAAAECDVTGRALSDTFWPGWHFQVPLGTEAHVTGIGYFTDDAVPPSGTMFLALAQLEAADDYPNPANLHGDELMALMVRDWPTVEGDTFVELEATLEPGWYGVFAGTHDHGAFGGGSGPCHGHTPVVGMESSYSLMPLTNSHTGYDDEVRFFVTGDITYTGLCSAVCETCSGPGPTGCTACATGYTDADPGDGFNCVDEDEEQFFYCTETPQIWVVPDEVTEIQVEVYGAAGGDGFRVVPHTDPGGYGGQVLGTLPVTPGETLYVNVGCQGEDGGSTPGLGGYNGGGDGDTYFSVYNTAGGGGGASDIRRGGTALGDRIVVAAGGGGAGAVFDTGSCAGGGGGGLTGSAGVSGGGSDCDGPTGCGGAGGTQSAGGAGGIYTAFSSYYPGPGTLGNGGDADTTAGGGGGGGYYGGGAGEFGGGGGGSSYIDSSATDVIHIPNYWTSDGEVVIRWTAPCSTVNLALSATPSSSGGGTSPYEVEKLNDGYLEADCNIYRWHWVTAPTSPSTAWFQYTWSEPQTITGFFVDSGSVGVDCTGFRPLAEGMIQWWSGTSWVDDVSVSDLTGDWSHDFSTPINTTQLRIYGAQASTTSPGIYEWEVYGCE